MDRFIHFLAKPVDGPRASCTGCVRRSRRATTPNRGCRERNGVPTTRERASPPLASKSGMSPIVAPQHLAAILVSRQHARDHEEQVGEPVEITRDFDAHLARA